MRWLIWIALLPGCVYFASDDDDGGDDCLDRPQGGAPLPQRDPSTLQCETYGGGGCDPACGPCPLNQPAVTWPFCDGTCEQHGEAECAADPNCRVILHADCAVGLNCLTNFYACYPIDTAVDASVNCFNNDAWTCSRSNACTAYHSYTACPSNDEACPRPFEMCTPEGVMPGRCYDQVTCRALPPDCPSGTLPGVANECWTGACIPVGICEGQ